MNFQIEIKIDKAFKALAKYEKHAVKRTPINRLVATTFYTKSDMYQSIGQSEKLRELLAALTKYSPEFEARYRCGANIFALERDYKIQMNKDEFAACRQVYQSYGDGYGKLFEVMASYQSGDYDNCLKILDADKGRIEKLFTNKNFLAKVYTQAGEIEKAKEMVKKAIDQKTDQPVYYYQMAALLEKEDKKAAKEYLDIALQYWSDADVDYIPWQRAKELADQLAL